MKVLVIIRWRDVANEKWKKMFLNGLAVMAFSVTIGASSITPVASAEEVQSPMTQKDVILQEYREALWQCEISSKNVGMTYSRRSNTAQVTTAQIQTNAVEALVAAGYEAYDVTPQTYDELEHVLNTDLDGIGSQRFIYYFG